MVTTIFHWRALEQLGYDAIADRLNTDLTAHPPPQPVDPRRAVGRWTGSAVREILANPKYTGYTVWNRRASKKGGHHNPAADWVWSSSGPCPKRSSAASTTPSSSRSATTGPATR